MKERKEEHKVFLSKREFLNNDKTMHGSIMSVVSQDISHYENKKGEKSSNCWTNASLTISDCNRVITLSFDVDTENELKNSLAKIERVIDHATRLRDAVQKAHISTRLVKGEEPAE
jgi:hypothetical protein